QQLVGYVVLAAGAAAGAAAVGAHVGARPPAHIGPSALGGLGRPPPAAHRELCPGGLAAAQGRGGVVGVARRPPEEAACGRSCCACCLPRYCVWGGLGSTTTFLRLGAIRCLRRV